MWDVVLPWEKLNAPDAKMHHCYIDVYLLCQVIMIYYCEIIINRGVLIFADFLVHLNHENKNLTKYSFPIDCWMKCLKPRIQEPMDQCIL
jgi:hypothetical protein